MTFDSVIAMSGSSQRMFQLALSMAGCLSAYGNLIADPGFESGSSSALWGGSAVVTSEVRTGTYCARLNQNDTWGGGYERTITGLSSNTTYTFSAYVKTVGGSVSVGVKDYGGSQVAQSVDSVSYVLVAVEFTTGATDTSATCFVYNGLGNASLAYADDLSLTGGDPPPPTLPPLPPLPVATGDYELIFSDEFNTVGSIDLTKWKPEVGFKRNNEDQYYRAENLSQDGDHLVITAKREQFLNANYELGSSDWRKSQQYASWTSGSIQTVDSFDFLYGKIECRAKVTNLTGTWPAIWTVGGGEWPATGEIDIMENYAGKILANFATAANGRWTAAWDSASVQVSSYPAGWVDDFHTWELIWEPGSASILLDGVTLNTFTPSTLNSAGSYAHPGVAPFQTFGQLLWLNLAIGGAGGDPSGLPNETVYLVDYIRVYQREHPTYRARLGRVNAADLQLDFQSVEGRRYSVKESDNLSTWTELTNLRGTGQTMSHTESDAASSTKEFYKVEVDNSQWIDADTP